MLARLDMRTIPRRSTFVLALLLAGVPGSSQHDVAPVAPEPPRDVRPDEALADVDVWALDGDRVHTLGASSGLQLVDVSSKTTPRALASLPMPGRPIALWRRAGDDVVVMAEARSPTEDGHALGDSLVRTVDVRDPSRPRVRAELLVRGRVVEARAAGDALWLLSEPSSGAPRLEVTRVAIVAEGLFASGAWSRTGSHGQLFSVGARLFLARTESSGECAESTTVEELTEGTHPRGHAAIVLPGGLPQWGADEGRAAVDVHGTLVRVLTCDPLECATSVAACRLVTLDVDRASSHGMRVRGRGAWIAASAMPIVRMSRDRAYVAALQGAAARRSSTVVVYDLSDVRSPRAGGAVQVSGIVRNIVARGARAVVVSSLASGDGRRFDLVVQEIDARDARAPYATRAVLGDGSFTSSPAAETSRAAALPSAPRAAFALPYSSWEAPPARPRSGVAFFTREDGWVPRQLELAGASPRERIAPLPASEGQPSTRWLVVGDAGVAIVDLADPARPLLLGDTARHADPFTRRQAAGAGALARVDQEPLGRKAFGSFANFELHPAQQK